MRYSTSETLEIIRLVEQSHLPVRRTLGQIGIPRSTFYRWYDQYQTGGPEALDDRSPRPDRVWNRIPDDVRSRVVTLALDEPELSPREPAVRFTDAERFSKPSTRSRPQARQVGNVINRGFRHEVALDDVQQQAERAYCDCGRPNTLWAHLWARCARERPNRRYSRVLFFRWRSRQDSNL